MAGVAGLTATDATGTVTVMAAVPFFPSLVAVIVTGPPPALPVTRPFASTEARLASLDCQVIVRPGGVLPFASFAAAASCTVAPAPTPAAAGRTSTDGRGGGVAVAGAPP